MRAITTIPSIDFSDVRIIDRDGQKWITAVDLATALGYSDTSAVNRIYTRRKDEFTPSMTSSVKMTDQGQARHFNVFSPQGAHLIAMFAKTPVAEGFRKWVLELIEREREGRIAPVGPIQVEEHSEDPRMGQSLEASHDYINLKVQKLEDELARWKAAQDILRFCAAGELASFAIRNDLEMGRG